MAAPAATVRQAPAGLMMEDGFPTKYTFERFPAVSFAEKSCQPPGIDGGDAIETKTMHNVTWETMAPRQLMKLTEGKITAAYDPAVLSTIVQMINVNDVISVTFPDGTTWAFWGFLQKFEPSDMSEGEHPEADITIVPTNRDNDGAEQGPVIVEVAGT